MEVAEKLQFQCTGCGLCCSNVGKIVVDARKAHLDGVRSPMNAAILKFPYKWNEKGKCEKLGADGKCEVYEDRPEICNVEKMFDKIGGGMTLEQYYGFQGSCCNIMIKAAGLNDKFLVKETY